MVRGQNSICQRIRNSPNLVTTFQGCVKAMVNNRTLPDSVSRVKNLGFALHRFDSLLRPLTRVVLLLEAVMRALSRFTPPGPSRGPTVALILVDRAF